MPTTLLLWVASGLCISAMLVGAPSASAALVGEVTEFSTGITPNSAPSKITQGPEGDLWFTERSTYDGSRIARITPAGEVTQYSVLEFSEPQGIALGPEGDLWFTEVNNPDCKSGECVSQVGRINPATHEVAEFSMGITAGSQPWEIASGPDGNLWFTERNGPGNAGRVARINPTTHVVTEFSAGITGDTAPDGITAGPDGNVWFTEEVGDRIGRITPSGTIAEFPIPTANSQPVAIVTGPDGNLWFAEQDSTEIGRITPTGTITEFPLPSSDGEPRSIAAGPDGNIWFGTDNGEVGRITPAGVITTCMAGMSSDIEGLTAGPGQSMWFAEYYGNTVGKITATGTGLASNCTSGSTQVPVVSPSSSGSTTTTATTTTPTTPTTPTTTAPTATVRLDGSNLGVTTGVASVKLTCSGTATCLGKVTLTVKSKPEKGKTETIGVASFSILAGETRLIRVKIQAVGQALLRAAHGNLGAALKIAKASPSPGKTEIESVRLKQQKAVRKS